MELYQLQLEELENVNGGLVPVEPAEGFNPSGPNYWGGVTTWPTSIYNIYKKLRP